MVTYASHKHKRIRIERLLPFGAIFFSIRNGCEIWYNKRMANKNTTKTRRRPSKAELERKQAIQRMLISLGIALLLIIAALKLGAAGVTLYNLIRLVVGSLAYVAIGALLIYLFLFKWIRKQEGLLSGFLCIFAGLLLIFEAYLVWKFGLEQSVLKGTLSQVMTDLTGMRVTSFAGGGLLGVGLYIPISFLFSNIGSYFIGVLLILVGALLVSPWSIYDVAAFIGAQFRSFMEKQEQRKQERFIKKEEEKARQEAEEAARIQREQEEQDALPLPPVDPETGEILSEVPDYDFPQFLRKSGSNRRLSSLKLILTFQMWKKILRMKRCRLIFLLRKPLNTSYQACNSLRQINPKISPRKRRLFEKISKS